MTDPLWTRYLRPRVVFGSGQRASHRLGPCLLGLCLVGLLAAGCGSDNDDSSSDPADTVTSPDSPDSATGTDGTVSTDGTDSTDGTGTDGTGTDGTDSTDGEPMPKVTYCGDETGECLGTLPTGFAPPRNQRLAVSGEPGDFSGTVTAVELVEAGPAPLKVTVATGDGERTLWTMFTGLTGESIAVGDTVEAQWENIDTINLNPRWQVSIRRDGALQAFFLETGSNQFGNSGYPDEVSSCPTPPACSKGGGACWHFQHPARVTIGSETELLSPGETRTLAGYVVSNVSNESLIDGDCDIAPYQLLTGALAPPIACDQKLSPAAGGCLSTSPTAGCPEAGCPTDTHWSNTVEFLLTRLVLGPHGEVIVQGRSGNQASGYSAHLTVFGADGSLVAALTQPWGSWSLAGVEPEGAIVVVGRVTESAADDTGLTLIGAFDETHYIGRLSAAAEPVGAIEFGGTEVTAFPAGVDGQGRTTVFGRFEGSLTLDDDTVLSTETAMGWAARYTADGVLDASQQWDTDVEHGAVEHAAVGTSGALLMVSAGPNRIYRYCDATWTSCVEAALDIEVVQTAAVAADGRALISGELESGIGARLVLLDAAGAITLTRDFGYGGFQLYGTFDQASTDVILVGYGDPVSYGGGLLPAGTSLARLTATGAHRWSSIRDVTGRLSVRPDGTGISLLPGIVQAIDL